MQQNKISAFIEKRLKMPSYLILLLGMITRSLIGILAASIPGGYQAWPLWWRLTLEIAVFLGVFASGEIVFYSAVVARSAAVRLRKVARLSAPPVPTGNAVKAARQLAAWNTQRDAAISNHNEDIRAETFISAIAGIISGLYAGNFIVQVWFPDPTLTKASDLIIEIASVISVFVVIYYYAARMRESKPDIEAESENMVVQAVSARIGVAGERVVKGTHKDEDVTILDLSLPNGNWYKRLMPALAAHGVTQLSTADIFRVLNISDESEKRAIRRRLYMAHEAHKFGVMKDPQSGAWVMPSTSLADWMLWNGKGSDRRQTRRGKIHAAIAAATRLDVDTPQTTDASGADTGQTSPLPLPPRLAWVQE